MFEYFKKGFGFTFGSVISIALTNVLAKRLLETLKQHESSEEEEDA